VLFRSIDRLKSSTDEMPVLPQLAVKLMEEMRNPDTTATRLAEFTKKDPILASTVLRVANSALYGARQEITDLSFAIARIGLNQARNLMLATVLRSQMADPQVYGTRGAELMDHALAVAFGASLVSSACQQDDGESFLCGLLHDFGRFALIKVLRDECGDGVSDLAPDAEAWIDRFHPEAGALLAETWGLAEVVCETTRFHHHPQYAPDKFTTAAAVVSMANELAHYTGLGADPDPGRDPMNSGAASLLPADQKAMDDVIERLPGLFQTARSALFK
jgi:HD-like signal output (HDOD) protein